MKYKPAKVDVIPGYVWYCAFSECMAKEYILHSQIYDLVNCYNSRESAYHGGKWFETEEEAMKALDSAFRKLTRDIEIRIGLLPKEQILELLPTLEYVCTKGRTTKGRRA